MPSLREEWVRIPGDKIVPDYAPDGDAYLFVMQVGSKHDFPRPGQLNKYLAETDKTFF